MEMGGMNSMPNMLTGTGSATKKKMNKRKKAQAIKRKKKN
jgi:hypothetical protein